MNNTIKIEFGFGIGLDAQQVPISPETTKAGLDWIKNLCITLFDGYTLTATQGGWRNPAGILVEEPGFTLTVYTPSFGADTTRNKISTVVTLIKRTLCQEAVCVTQSSVNSEIL